MLLKLNTTLDFCYEILSLKLNLKWRQFLAESVSSRKFSGFINAEFLRRIYIVPEIIPYPIIKKMLKLEINMIYKNLNGRVLL